MKGYLINTMVVCTAVFGACENGYSATSSENEIEPQSYTLSPPVCDIYREGTLSAETQFSDDCLEPKPYPSPKPKPPPPTNPSANISAPLVSSIGSDININWSAQGYDYWFIQYRENSGSWKNDGGHSNTSKIIRNVTNTVRRQYRIQGCLTQASNDFCRLKSNWSPASTSISLPNDDEPTRSIRDDNGNGVRDDVDNYSAAQYPNNALYRGSLIHFAKYLKKFMYSNFYDRNEMLTNMNNMQSALICMNSTKIGRHHVSKIKAMMWDSRESYRQYLAAEAAYAKYGLAAYINVNRCYLNNDGTINKLVEAMEFDRITQMVDSNQSNIATHYLNADMSLESENDDSQVLVQNLTELKSGQLTNSNSSRFKYVIYVNGMRTDIEAASANRKILSDKLEAIDNNYVVSLSYNRDEGWKLELADVLSQHLMQISDVNYNGAWRRAHELINDGFISQPEIWATRKAFENAGVGDNAGSATNREDLDGLLKMIEQRKEHGNIVLLSHSQGNFFANEAVRRLNVTDRDSINYLRMVSVATPAFNVGFNGPHVTNTEDEVILAIRDYSPINPLPANIYSNLEGDQNHGFVETYLNKDIFPTVLNHIQKMHEELLEDEVGGECNSLHVSGSGSKTQYYNPGYNYEGWITLNFDPFVNSNSLTILNQIGQQLLYTGAVSIYSFQFRYYYRSEKDGFLTIAVRNTGGAPRDQWKIAGRCN